MKMKKKENLKNFTWNYIIESHKDFNLNIGDLVYEKYWGNLMIVLCEGIYADDIVGEYYKFYDFIFKEYTFDFINNVVPINYFKDKKKERKY